MPISGLVLTLDHSARPDQVRQQVRLLPGICTVQPGGRRIALVLDTADAEADRCAWQALEATPGVQHVDVVFIHFDQPESPLPHRSMDHARHR